MGEILISSALSLKVLSFLTPSVCGLQAFVYKVLNVSVEIKVKKKKIWLFIQSYLYFSLLLL